MSRYTKNINCVDIAESYTENVNHNIEHKKVDDVIQRLADDSKKINDKSLFEIIPNSCSPYFDIETIPYDQPKLIISIKDAIIKTLQTYGKIELPKKVMRKGITPNNLMSSYIITINKQSLTHSGLSYHIIFPNLLTTQRLLKEFVYVLTHDYSEYKPYIDQSVYSKNRLFRLPYQAGINPPTMSRGRDANSIHVIEYAHFLSSLSINKYIDYIPNDSIDFGCIKSIIPACIISNHKYKQARYITFKYPEEITTYIKQQRPKAISQTTMYIKDENIKQVYKERKQARKLTDEDIYNKCVVINELTTNEAYKNKVNEFIEYYKANNKSFNNFRITLEQIHGILTIMETKC